MRDDVAERLNLTSPAALARIGREINDRYRMVASSIGMQTTARSTATATTTIGNRALTFGPTPVAIEKVYVVYDPSASPPRVLEPVTFDEMAVHRVLGTDPPHAWAVQSAGPSSVTIRLDVIPAAAYPLTADVLANVSALSGSMVPNFAESFHDLLMYGAMATELEKMEKYEMAKKQEAFFRERISDLRFFLAKNAFQTFYQGKTNGRAV
jgi:hypothetical protein